MNQFDTVGPTFRPVRLSLNATVVFRNCILRRRAGLPYKAAIVNMREAPRPPGFSGPQVCVQVTGITYRSTGTGKNVTIPAAVNMSDYATVATPDRYGTSETSAHGPCDVRQQRNSTTELPEPCLASLGPCGHSR
jgi:hypothetical protein